MKRILQIMPVVLVAIIAAGCSSFVYIPDLPTTINTITFDLNDESYKSESGKVSAHYNALGDSVIFYTVLNCPESQISGLMADKSDNSVICTLRIGIPQKRMKYGQTFKGDEMDFRLAFYTFSAKHPFPEYLVRYKAETSQLKIAMVDEDSIFCRFKCSGTFDDGGVFDLGGKSFSIYDGLLYVSCPNAQGYSDFFAGEKSKRENSINSPRIGFLLNDDYYCSHYRSKVLLSVDYNERKDSIVIYASPQIPEDAKDIKVLTDKMLDDLSLSFRMAVPAGKSGKGSLTEKDCDISLRLCSSASEEGESLILYKVEKASVIIKEPQIEGGLTFDYSCSGTMVYAPSLNLDAGHFTLEGGYLVSTFPRRSPADQ